MRDFLDFLMPPEGYVEIRAIRDGVVKQWWDKDRQGAVDLAIQQSDLGWDAYYGVIPRTARAGDAAHVLPTTIALWADLDAKTIGSKQAALMSLVRYSIPPSVVVDSGHGYHAYWRLEEPAVFSRARHAMVGIALELRGDHVYDQPRILRIPGTQNYKDPLIVPVRTVVFNTTQVMRFQNFYRQESAGMEHEQAPRLRPSVNKPYTPGAADKDLPEWLSELIRDGAPQGQRSEQCFKVMAQLAKRGWSDAEIEDAFERGGIGEKMREMRGGKRWFDHSMKKARASA